MLKCITIWVLQHFFQVNSPFSLTPSPADWLYCHCGNNLIMMIVTIFVFLVSAIYQMVNPTSNSPGLSLNNFKNNHPSGQVRENDVVKPQSSFFRDVSPPKKTGKCGNFEITGGVGGLPKSHFFCNLTKWFFGMPNSF